MSITDTKFTGFELVSELFSSKHASNHEAIYIRTGNLNLRHLRELCDLNLCDKSF